MTPTVPPQSSSALPSTPPAFTYEEAGDQLAFWPPATLRLVRRAGGRVCVSELSTGEDNMWTGPDLEAALGDPEVRSLLASGVHTFAPPDGAVEPPEGTLHTATGSIEWRRPPCPGCSAPPPGVQRIQRVLIGTMNNRRLLCPP